MIRNLLVLIGLMLLWGCNGASEDDGPEIVPIDQTAETTLFDAFQKLPEKLGDAVVFRKGLHDRLVLDEMFGDLMTEQELHNLFLAHQSLIERVIDATLSISPPVPPEPEYSEEDMQHDRHMDSVPVRLMNNSRLLLADAVRCWADEDYEGCSLRYAASMRIGLCLIDDADSANQLRGLQVCYPTIFEMELRLADGLINHLSDSSRRDLQKLLQNLDTSRALEWDDSAAVAQARRRANRLLGSDE